MKKRVLRKLREMEAQPIKKEADIIITEPVKKVEPKPKKRIRKATKKGDK